MKYVEPGEITDSIFGTNYKFGYYDEDCIEIFFYDKSSDKIEELLKDFSYDDIIIPQFKNIIEKLNLETNSIILLYDYTYEGLVLEDKSDDHYFKFIGVATYESYED